MPLAFVSQGQKAKVSEVNLSRDWQHRLAEMGIRPGEEIRVKRVEKGSFIIEHNDSQWVVGKGISTKVVVEIID